MSDPTQPTNTHAVPPAVAAPQPTTQDPGLMSTTAPAPATPPAPVLDRVSGEPVAPALAALMRHREEADKLQTTKLPRSGIKAHYPGFLPYDRLAEAQRIAGTKNSRKKRDLQAVLIAKVCSFGDERTRLREDEISEFMDAMDVLHLTNLIMGTDDAEDDEGNS